MKRIYLLIALAALGIVIFSESHTEEAEPAVKISAEELVGAGFNKADIQKISNAFGHMIGKNLDNPGFKFDVEEIIQGIRDGAEGKASPMTEDEYEEAIVRIQETVFNELADKNLAAAEEFLRENLLAQDVVELEVGLLQITVLEEGNGEEVLERNSPLIHYTGKYLDGTVFGSSEDNGEPIRLALDQTISGLSKGLVGSKEGEKRRLFIHPDMAYKKTGHLPPNSLLIFDIEILKANDESVEEDALGMDMDLEGVSETFSTISAEEAEDAEEIEGLQ